VRNARKMHLLPREMRLDFRASGHGEALESHWPRPASGTRLRRLQHGFHVLVAQGIDELAAHEPAAFSDGGRSDNSDRQRVPGPTVASGRFHDQRRSGFDSLRQAQSNPASRDVNDCAPPPGLGFGVNDGMRSSNVARMAHPSAALGGRHVRNRSGHGVAHLPGQAQGHGLD
jgi:hypothetical protein